MQPPARLIAARGVARSYASTQLVGLGRRHWCPLAAGYLATGWAVARMQLAKAGKRARTTAQCGWWQWLPWVWRCVCDAPYYAGMVRGFAALWWEVSAYFGDLRGVGGDAE